MDPLVRKLALRATAKVALGMTVVGCASTVDVEKQQNGSVDHPSDPPGVSETPYGQDGGQFPTYIPTQPGEELMCNAPALGGAVPLDDDQLLCCVDELTPITPTDGEGWEAWTEVMKDDDIRACCSVVNAHANVDFAKIDPFGWEKFNACCQALDFPGGACTPWGPPVPPEVFNLPPLRGFV